MARRLMLRIDADACGKTVDSILRRNLHLSTAVIRRIKWLPEGILLDGLRVSTPQRVFEGQTLSVLVGDDISRSDIVPADGPLDLVWEDDDLLVINKPAGILSHPGHGHFNDTLGNLVVGYYRKQGIRADYHPVHRLDKGTTGLIIIAKHAHAQQQLQNQLHTSAFRRVYLAVCEGVPEPLRGIIDAPIGRMDGSIIAREVRTDGLHARTEYQVLSSTHGRSLLRLELDTGRTHQIRVHMAYLGHPLTGDFLYGTENNDLIGRPALHSAEVFFLHPITGEPLSFSLPLPSDMAQLL